MDQVVTENQDNSISLCKKDSEAQLILSLFGTYYGLLVTVNILFLVFTVVKAKHKSKEMFDYEDPDEFEEDSTKDDIDLYEPIPEEYIDKRRQSEDKSKNSSNLPNIIEDDDESVFSEDDEDEERDYFPASDRSSASSNISRESDLRPSPVPALNSRSNSIDPFSRSNSTADCAPYRYSLTTGSTKNSKIKRTESQNKADYLLKVDIFIIANESHFKLLFLHHSLNPGDDPRRKGSGRELSANIHSTKDFSYWQKNKC